ncbi:unnamed protein product [Bursaphelenchus okinawaensis]|uniref:Protein kinase domain-containing protein n=1 Tax=Bursaphelenchus okinawaensis TaxID=465554 RepID=A0A811JUX5_9BILA|nr:unnamed protein product [Bursaphelenchus okinawaensis]CAG9083706.1 unnamed protein product [Bursaphelenchus okinawaensis]
MSTQEPESNSEDQPPLSTSSSVNTLTNVNVSQHNTPSPALTTSVTSAEEDKGSDSDGDAAEEILEESPDKRWSKRREKVKQRDVPGIDAAFLAMDNETGNEVVWNEVQFSERKNFREQEEKLRSVFDNLTQLVHINLVKFHKYWTDSKSEKPRMIFITEYMSSGSMSRFLQRARSSGTLLNIKAWKKWTTQILSALNYLHSCEPPIVHANLTCNTVFIQQNGLIKIGCVAPNAIHHHVKTFRENLKNMHYVAPEFDQLSEATTETDIYSFGICALEMATTGGLCCNGGSTESTSQVTPAMIRKAIDSLEDGKQRDFIESCLNPNPKKRPTARELLFHQALFEVHSLKLLAAHAIVNSKLIDHLTEEDLRVQDSTKIVATSKHKNVAYCELSTFQIDLDKFLEDVRNGIYPLIAFAPLAHLPTKMKLNAESAITGFTHDAPRRSEQKSVTYSNKDPENQRNTTQKTEVKDNKENNQQNNVKHTTTSNGNTSVNVPGKDEGYDTVQSGITPSGNQSGGDNKEQGKYAESRQIVEISANIDGNMLKATLKLDDMMIRELRTPVGNEDNAEMLANDLVHLGFICTADCEKVCQVLQSTLDEYRRQKEDDSGKSSRKSSRQHDPNTVVAAVQPPAADPTKTLTRPS